MIKNRDYGMLGQDAKRAEQAGLKSAAWYHTEMPRAQMKELMKRSDGPAIRDTIIWLGAMVLFAAWAIYSWPSWWAAIPLFCYGVLYGSATDSRWHECGHGTAFKTPWMNDVVYHIACFMIMRNPTRWRWSHTRHHTDTVIVGLDPEIAVMRPPAAVKTALAYVGILDACGKQLGSAALLRLDRSDVCELRSLAQRSLQFLQPCRVARRRRDGTRLVGVTAGA